VLKRLGSFLLLLSRATCVWRAKDVLDAGADAVMFSPFSKRVQKRDEEVDLDLVKCLRWQSVSCNS
jgi:hypothetical protein